MPVQRRGGAFALPRRGETGMTGRACHFRLRRRADRQRVAVGQVPDDRNARPALNLFYGRGPQDAAAEAPDATLIARFVDPGRAAVRATAGIRRRVAVIPSGPPVIVEPAPSSPWPRPRPAAGATARSAGAGIRAGRARRPTGTRTAAGARTGRGNTGCSIGDGRHPRRRGERSEAHRRSREPGIRRRVALRSKRTLRPLNLFVRGKPFGASRPASARLPRQSASSFSVSENSRPAASVQVSPSAP